MAHHWLWYAVGRLLLYWLLFFAFLACFTFRPYWLNDWPISTGQWIGCAAFALWAAAVMNFGHEVIKGTRNDRT
jgi:hypothetical protein